MKRMAALLLALLLCCGCAALAEVSDKTFQFRDLAWGASYEEINAQVGLNTLNKNTPHSVAFMMYGGEDITFEEDVDFYASYSADALGDVGKVAGYAVDGIYLFFSAVPDGSDAITGEAADTALYLARYDLRCNDWKAAFESLAGKLTRLYGDVDLAINDDPDYPVDVWYGAEGTMISLRKYNGAQLELRYASGDGDALRLAAMEANVAGL